MPQISGNFYLTMAQMKTNVDYIWNYCQTIEPEWTLNAVCGMLGNMQSESTINPGIWQDLQEGNLKGGFGLVQWTPASKYIDWCDGLGYDPSNMNSALLRISYEELNNLQWIATGSYNHTFSYFLRDAVSSPGALARAFLYCYERPEVPDPITRAKQAEAWYQYITGNPPPKERRKMPLYYYIRRL